MGLPLNAETQNLTRNYQRLTRGPLYPNALEDLTFALDKMPLDEVRDGVEIGPIPTIRIMKDGLPVAEGQVYPNHPLRYGPMLVHFLAYGYTAVAEVADEQGQRTTERLFFDFDDEGKFYPTILEMTSSSGTRRATIVPSSGRKSGGGSNRAVIVTYDTDDGAENTTELLVGETMKVGEQNLTLRDAALYARISVVDDWSVYLIYALFITATAGIAISVMMPRRQVFISAPASPQGSSVHAIVRHERDDPVFVMHVEEWLRSALGEADRPQAEPSTTPEGEL